MHDSNPRRPYHAPMADTSTGSSPTISFEFFPPATPAGWEALDRRIGELIPLEPSFVSVTYGAGGTTRDRTHDLVERLINDTSLAPVPHLTCVGHRSDDIDRILERYAEAGVDAILALRGDPPAEGVEVPTGDFNFASDLVAHIRSFGERHGHRFRIGVAGFPEGHPDTPNTLECMDHLQAKVDAGSDWICTQLFFDNHAFHDWKDRCRLVGIEIPIIAGIMPISTRKSIRRMAGLAAGTVFPASLQRSLARAPEGDDESIAEIGIHWATEQCRDLLDRQVDGIHFYTLNKSDATLRIHRNLGVRTSRGFQGDAGGIG
jgi:methylenetetrahydrofolate reductase (NADPH)